MSLESARTREDALSNIHGYCFPLAVDALLTNKVLPDLYYEMFSAAIEDPNGGTNEPKNKLLRDFFGVRPNPDTDIASVAEYNAFGASVQTYFPDVPYDYPELLENWSDTTVNSKHFRLRALLQQAAVLDCLVLFHTSGNETADHTQSLQLVDKGGAYYEPRFLMRNNSYIESPRAYDTNELSGISQALGEFSDDYSPLPEIARPHFPASKTSWELTILPPEPR